MPDRFDPPATRSTPQLQLTTGRVVVWGGLLLAGVFGAAVAWVYQNEKRIMALERMRSELPINVIGIKTAQMHYHSDFGDFLAVPEPVPRDIAYLDATLAGWYRGTPFDMLGWAPDGMVRGTYWIERVDARPQDFVVHGLCDVDEDGVPAHYTATRSTNPTMVSPSDVY